MKIKPMNFWLRRIHLAIMTVISTKLPPMELSGTYLKNSATINSWGYKRFKLKRRFGYLTDGPKRNEEACGKIGLINANPIISKT